MDDTYTEELRAYLHCVQRAESLTTHVQPGVLAAWVFTEIAEVYLAAEERNSWLDEEVFAELADCLVLFSAYHMKTGKQFLFLPSAANRPRQEIVKPNDLSALTRALFVATRGSWRRGVKPLAEEDEWFAIVKDGLSLFLATTTAMTEKEKKDSSRLNLPFYSDNQGHIHQVRELK